MTLATSNPTQDQSQYPSGSWGLGVVVPENSVFADGGRLSWANATMVSVSIRLPNMSFSDDPTLVVESPMAADGSVMQIAAGIYPTSTKWFAYGWYIRNVQANPQTYGWILNYSKPAMMAGDPVSLSIYLSQGRWHYRIEDLTTREAATGEYAPDVPPSLRVGDQEVFALESYSTSNIVFAQMGNLTLDNLTINGRRIASGWYGYGSWDTHHNPMFVVGGLDPPSYISLQQKPDGTVVWSYQEWSAATEVRPPSLPLTILGIPVLVASVMLVAVYALKRRIGN